MKKILLLILCVSHIILYPQTRQIERTDFDNSPFKSFEKYCSRCHGYEGSAYGKDFGNLEDKELKEVVNEMMLGPAQLDANPVEIEAMYAYNKSLRDNKPFAIVLNSRSYLEGEDGYLTVSISSEAELSTDDKQIQIEKYRDTYKLTYNRKEMGRIKITVRKKNISSSFYFPDKLWSE